MANVKNQEQQTQVNETAASKTDKFFSEYRKPILGTLIGALVAGLCIFAFIRFVYVPKCAEAQEQMFPAEQAFAAGNYEIALNGDGNILGFSQIIDDYGKKAGKAVYMYAGVSALQLGQYGDALNFLKKYKGDEPILAARAKACEGDAYVGLEDYTAAAAAFEAAAAQAENVFAAAYLLKAGLAYEELGKNDKALECYKNIRDNYAQSIEALEIEKYIAAIEAQEE